MPQFNSYKGNGRTLMVKFTCRRCGKEEIGELEKHDINNSYGSLIDVEGPRCWREYCGGLLCAECAQALDDFINNK